LGIKNSYWPMLTFSAQLMSAGFGPKTNKNTVSVADSGGEAEGPNLETGDHGKLRNLL
jgi:hypothetical protein